MPQIRFTSDPKIPSDKVREWAEYVKDSVHEVNNSEADRWLRRGVAEVFIPPVVVSKVQEPKSETLVSKPEVVSKVEEIIKIEEKDISTTPVGVQTVTPKPQTPVPTPAVPRTR